MDPRDPTQPASIFSKPDPADDPHAAARESSPPRPAAPIARRSVRPEPAPPSGPSRQLLIGLGVGGLMILAIGGFVAASILGPNAEPAVAVASPSTPPSTTPTPAATPTAAPTVTPSPSPTPAPTPSGPVQDLAVETWATVAAGELNVRGSADMNAASHYVLVRGAVVHVLEGPAVVGGLNWYRITSLGGATGWAASGWVEEPFMTTLVDDSILVQCGEVQRSVFDIVDGAPVPHDPLTIGDLALPVAAFSDFSLGTLELMRGVGKDACFTAELDANGTPTITVQLDVYTCGRAEREGSFFRLRPAAGQALPPEVQLKAPSVVHPAVLTSAVPNDPMAANLRNIALLIAERTDTTGCIYLSVQDGPGIDVRSAMIDTTQCFLIYEQANDGITLGAAAGGDTKRILVSEGSMPPFTVALGVPTQIGVSATSSTSGSYGHAYTSGFDVNCH